MGEMKLLIDTHIFLWWISGDARLSQTVKAALRDTTNERYVSSVSVAEMAIKTSLKKLRLSDRLLIVQATAEGMTLLTQDRDIPLYGVPIIS